jgi:hypothetical protein
MSATPIESHALSMHAPDTTGRCAPVNDDPIVLLLYGEEHVNLALADELELDGYEVRRASDAAKLRAVCGSCEVELVIFGRATRRGAGLDVLRKLRAGGVHARGQARPADALADPERRPRRRAAGIRGGSRRRTTRFACACKPLCATSPRNLA